MQIEIPKYEINEQGPREQLLTLSYLAPPPEFTRTIRRHLRTTLVVAPMGFGKTSLMEAKIGESIQHLVEEQGVDEQEIAVVYGAEKPLSEIIAAIRSSNLDPTRIRYLYIFIDDALAAPGQHGRRAATRENVEESQLLTMIRHRLKTWGYEGYTHLVYATQVYTGVDVTIRRVAKLKAFKDLPDEKADFKHLAWMLGSAGLSYLAKLNTMLTTPRNPWEFLTGVYTAVAKLGARRWIMRAYPKEAAGTPRIEEEVQRRREWLMRAHYLDVTSQEEGGEEDPSNTINITDHETIEKLVHVIARLLEEADIIKKGADVLVRIPAPRRVWLRKTYIELLEHLGLQLLNGKR